MALMHQFKCGGALGSVLEYAELVGDIEQKLLDTQ